MCTRFGRDRHQLLIRQFYTLKQTDTVANYIERFEHIMNNLLAYSDTIHPLYFLSRFIEGLRNDIRAVVKVQRPPDLDSACALALLQEEVIDSLKPTGSRYHDMHHRGRPLPLPAPPQNRGVLQNVTNTFAEGKPIDAAKENYDHGSKLQTLKAYRRARGLCFKCGERWGQDRTCPATIQLHIVEELLDFLGADALGIQDQTAVSQPAEHLCTVSLQALSEKLLDISSSPSVLQLQGCLLGQPVTMLVDSGSTASFITVSFILQR